MGYFTDEELPEKLTDEEIRKYIEKYQLGYVSARNVVWEHNLKLLLFVANKFGNTGYDFEELVEVGLFGLLKSIDTFNLSKDNKFSTYAARCISNEILTFLRVNQKYKYNINIDEILLRYQNSEEFYNETEFLYDDSSDFVLDYEDAEVYRVVREVVENLPSREREIIMLHFGFYNGKIYTQKQIAKKLGISQGRISRLEKKILEGIREKLLSYGVIDVLESDLVLSKELSYGIEDTKRYYN